MENDKRGSGLVRDSDITSSEVQRQRGMEGESKNQRISMKTDLEEFKREVQREERSYAIRRILQFLQSVGRNCWQATTRLQSTFSTN